jgi:hypothetical protein
VDRDAAVQPSTTRRRVLALFAFAPLVVVYGWWATGLRPFTWSSLVAILAPGVVLVAVSPKLRGTGPSLASWFTSQQQEISRRGARGYGVWIVIVGAIVLWQLVNLFWLPRTDHPTLSSMLGAAENHPGRLALFVSWLALGWYLTRE